MARVTTQARSDVAARKRRHEDLVEASRALARQGTPEDARREPVRRNRLDRPKITYRRRGQSCHNRQSTSLPTRARQAYRALRSHVVPDFVLEERNRVCAECRFLSIVQIHDQVAGFCECCGCGQWAAFGTSSSIADKNRLAEHECSHDPPFFTRYEASAASLKQLNIWQATGALAVAAWKTLVSKN